MEWMPIDLRHLEEYPCLNWEVWVLLKGVTKGSRLSSDVYVHVCCDALDMD